MRALGGMSDGAWSGTLFDFCIIFSSSSSSGMMLGRIAGVGMLALLAVAVVRSLCGGVGMLAVVVVRLIHHILAPLDSRMPHSMIVPWAS